MFKHDLLSAHVLLTSCFYRYPYKNFDLLFPWIPLFVLPLFYRYPSLTWQQAVNDLQSSEPYKDGVASLDTAHNQCDLCFRWSNRPQDQDPNYLTLSNLPQVTQNNLPVHTEYQLENSHR